MSKPSIQYIVTDRATSGKYFPIFVGVLIVVGIVAVVIIGKKILEGTGVIDTKFDNRLPRLNGFNPDYYKDNISRVTISTAVAQKIADDIYYSYGLSSSTSTSIDNSNPALAVLQSASIFSGGGSNNGRKTFVGNDDEQRLHGAIQQAGSEYNLSRVSDLFQKKYGEAMVSYIINFADNSDTEAIYKIIKDYKS